MANIGEQLLQPESGCRRIDDSNLNIKYIGNWNTTSSASYNYYNSTLHSTKGSVDNKIEFYFYGTKLSIISSYYTDMSSNISIEIDDIIDSFSCNNSLMYQVLAYKKENLEKTIHYVKIYSSDSLGFIFDAIDIDEDGYMIYCDDNGKLYYDVTPIMTSNTTPEGYEVSASSSYIDNIEYKAFDSAIDRYPDGHDGWVTDNVVYNGWLNLKSDNKILMDSLIIYPRYNIHPQAPKNFKILGSNDGENYNIIQEYNNITDWGDYKIFNLNKTYSYKNYKIDVDNTNIAVGVGELRYLLAVDTPFYLIQDNSTNKIYNYDEENDQLTEVADISILKVDALNNTCIYDLTKVKDLIDLTDDNITILSNQDAKLIVDGIKNDKELIVSNQNLSIVNAETVHNFLFDITKVSNGSCKFVISADNGQTWLSWNGSSWDTLIHTSPLDNNKIKQYSKLSDSEKIQWNKLRDEIWTSGMSTDITDVDYNIILTNKTIRFAFVLYRPTYDDNITLKDTKWLYDKVGSWHKLSEDDIDIAINSNMCTVTPKLQNLEHVKVNILL